MPFSTPIYPDDYPEGAGTLRTWSTLGQARAYARAQLDARPDLSWVPILTGEANEATIYVYADTPHDKCPADCVAGRWIADEPFYAAEPEATVARPGFYTQTGETVAGESASARAEDSPSIGEGLFLYAVERCRICRVFDTDQEAAEAEGDSLDYVAWGLFTGGPEGTYAHHWRGVPFVASSEPL